MFNHVNPYKSMKYHSKHIVYKKMLICTVFWLSLIMRVLRPVLRVQTGASVDQGALNIFAFPSRLISQYLFKRGFPSQCWDWIDGGGLHGDFKCRWICLSNVKSGLLVDIGWIYINVKGISVSVYSKIHLVALCYRILSPAEKSLFCLGVSTVLNISCQTTRKY